ncbi:hypothetical protein F4782DRAFT_43708 [Xylaria castorea]|nr:hypothetical protein F4782DRAFT_43708 [Xylaria castorea]
MPSNKVPQPDNRVIEMLKSLCTHIPSENSSEESDSGHEFEDCEFCESDSCENHTITHEIREIREITDISTWSELSKYITAYHPNAFDEAENESYVDIHLTCDICHDKRLRLPCWIDSSAYLSEDCDSEDLCVLPCGHFFGHHCIKQWADQKKDGIPDCPNCRFALLYPECEHPIKLKALRDLNDFEPNDIPILVPNSRVHKLAADGKTFVDITPGDPELFDAAVNFGVPDDCYKCAKQKMIDSWERIRRRNTLW